MPGPLNMAKSTFNNLEHIEEDDLGIKETIFIVVAKECGRCEVQSPKLRKTKATRLQRGWNPLLGA